MSNFINVEESTIIKTVHKIKIDIPYLILNAKCMVRVLCYDENEEFIHKYEFELVDDDYLQWQTDEWLVNYVKQKYFFNNDVLENEN